MGKNATRNAIAILENSLDRDHPRMASSLHGLAEVYAAQGEHAAADALWRRALQIRQAALGPGHPQVAATLEQISALYVKMDRHDDARQFAERAARIRAQK